MSNRLDIVKTVHEQFLADIPTAIRQNLSSKQPLWLACSGGRDSMALLNVCHQLDIPIHVIHVNHQLQAPSDDWQALVADFCQNKAIAFTAVVVNWEAFFLSQHKPVPNLANINEQQARQARYQAMIGVMEHNASIQDFPVLALAHHANDQAETMLLNLCQGTGLAGLIGMRSWTLQPEFGTPLYLWRPLLTVSREQISEYVSEQAIPFVDDPTNIAGDNQRAFLRQQILPKLNERFGGLAQNLSRTRQNLAEVCEIIAEQVQIDFQSCQLGCDFSKQTQLSLSMLKNLSHARRLQLLHFWLKGEHKFAPNRDFVLQVNELVLRDNPEQQALLHWQGFAIRRYRDGLYRLSPDYLNSLKQQKITIRLASQTTIFQELPINIRKIELGEQFARFSSQNPFHESYKKICQRFNVPSWERGLGRVVVFENTLVALLLPRHSVWLVGAEILIEKGIITKEGLLDPCVWYIEPDIK